MTATALDIHLHHGNLRGVKRVPKIFISYRHNDASESASRLHETLTGCFGSRHIFWDHDSIHGGRIFLKDIQNAVNSSTTLLAVIGRDWLTIKEDDERRLDDAKDIVRWEIATALERADKGEDINVIPVLVEGASFPREQDLPDDLKKLVDHDYVEIRPQNWRDDVKPLIQIIEKDFRAAFIYSFLGGAIAGLISGVIVGWLYYASSTHPDVGVDRIFVGGLYGLFSGATLSYFINTGITWRSRLLNKSPYSQLVGGAVGGALGGILAGIVGGFSFAYREGGTLDPKHLTLAVASSSVFITLGILLPELKGAWHKTVLPIIIIVCVTLVTVSVTVWVLNKQLPGLIGYLANDSPFSKGVLILGLICGSMSGFQVGSALFVYDRFKDKLGINL